MSRRPDPSTLLVAILAVLADRIAETVAVHVLPLGRTIWVVDHVFALTRIANTGAAFGMLPGQVWLFTVAAVAVIGAALVLPRQERLVQSIGYGLLAGGAAGNLWDRLVAGSVVDYLNVTFWPGIFNAADVFVVVGVCLILISLLRR